MWNFEILKVWIKDYVRIIYYIFKLIFDLIIINYLYLIIIYYYNLTNEFYFRYWFEIWFLYKLIIDIDYWFENRKVSIWIIKQ